ncbi:hypothetical protein ACFZAU_34100 [Streptomyces sp. NPDC008238]
MEHAGTGGGQAWVTAARERLRAGAAPAAVCGELAARTPRWSDSALAVGLALGIAEPELLRRLHGEPGRLQEQFRAGEERWYGELMAAIGVFDVPRPLDERESAVAGHLRDAIRAMGGVASGAALGLSRGFVRGELTGVFRSLARLGPRAAGGGRPRAFWAALVAAGELLDQGPDDKDGLARTLEQCGRRLADHTGDAF